MHTVLFVFLCGSLCDPLFNLLCAWQLNSIVYNMKYQQFHCNTPENTTCRIFWGITVYGIKNKQVLIWIRIYLYRSQKVKLCRFAALCLLGKYD